MSQDRKCVILSYSLDYVNGINKLMMMMMMMMMMMKMMMMKIGEADGMNLEIDSKDEVMHI